MSIPAAAGLDPPTDPKAGTVTTVPVALGPRSYDIHIGEGLIGRAGDIVKPLLRRPRTAIVTDENVADHHLEPLLDSLSGAGIAHDSIVLVPGEATKSFSDLAQLCDRLLGTGIERGDCIIALGGGVIGDLAGFAAAIVLRGIGFIQVPTTLLAQVDSSVGGKTGINSALGKNLIGAFHQPLCVIADTAALATLPRRELAAGYAEVAKYGLIGDAAFFAWLEDNAARLFAGDREALGHAVNVSCRAKARVVQADETEAGVRALLNLGHTFGHALEAAAGFGGKLLHGEAVAVGMAMAFRFSEHAGVCRAGAAERVAGNLASIGLPTAPRDLAFDVPGPKGILDLMRKDKKTRAGRLTLILARDIGEAFIAPDVADEDVLGFLAEELRA
jgi:3-dehydroquinate synthase